MKDIHTIVALLAGGRLDRTGPGSRLAVRERGPSLVADSFRGLAGMDRFTGSRSSGH